MGSGAFALVLKAATTREEHVAVKIMSRRNFNARGIGKQLDREVHLLKNLEHPNIVGLLDTWESGDAVFVVLELCELGDLSQILAREIKLNESMTAHYMKQLLEALACVHQFPAVHRDVKPDNLLITSRYELKLTDFGWAAELEPDIERRRTLSGTFVYMAPEVLAGEDQDERVDSWSAGAVMYEMLTGRPLLQTFIGAGATGLSAQDPFRSTAERQRRLLAEIGGLNLARVLLQLNLSPECDQLIRALLCTQKDKRLRCEDAQFEPFVSKVARRSTADRRVVLGQRAFTSLQAQAAKNEPAPTALSTRLACTPREAPEMEENVPTPERPSRGERNAYTPPLSDSPEKKCDEEVLQRSATTTAASSPHLQPSNTSILWRDSSAPSDFGTLVSADAADIEPTETSIRSVTVRPRYCPSPTVPPRPSPPAPAPRACGAYRSISDRLSCTMIPRHQDSRHQEVSCDPLCFSVKTQNELNYSAQRTHNLGRPVQHSTHLDQLHVVDQLQRTMPAMPLRKPARGVAVPATCTLETAPRVSPAPAGTVMHARRAAVGTTDMTRRSMVFMPPPRSVIYR
jgi:serine/threonine protein kinase